MNSTNTNGNLKTSAALFVTEKISVDLSSYDDIIPGEQNVPFTLLVFAVDVEREGSSFRNYGMMTEEGKSITVSVYPTLQLEWNHITAGMVVTFDGNVTNTSNKIRVSVIGPPTEEEEKYEFIRGELPNGTTDNCSIVAVVDMPVERTSKTAPAKVKCFTGMGQEFNLQSFSAVHMDLLQNLRTGTIVHVAPAMFELKLFANEWTRNVNCHVNTIIDDVGLPNVNLSSVKNVASVKELENEKGGSVVKLTVALLRDIYNGTVSVVDVPNDGDDDTFTSGKLPRVNVVGIPAHINGTSGSIVDITASVTPTDYITLTYVNIVANTDHDGESANVQAYNRYMLLPSKSNGTRTATKRKNSSVSSQPITPTGSTGSTNSSQSHGSQKFVGTPLREPPVKKSQLPKGH